MLNRLSIRNIVLIDALDINFSGGFGVLTGETGAGKSILLGALGFVLGARAGSGLLRAGEKQGSVTACFLVENNSEIESLLEENALQVDKELILRRVVYADGKSKAFVNDIPVSVAMLGNIASHLVEIHGQHEQRGLLDTESHRGILDKYAQLEGFLAKVNSAYDSYNGLKRELAQLEALVAQSSAEEDYLQFVKKELEELNPQLGEEVELATKRAYLINSEKITTSINAASELMSKAAMHTVLPRIQGYLREPAKVEPQLQAVIEALDRAAIEIEESSVVLDKILSNLDNANDNLDNVEQRLFALRAAARKYRITPEELPAYMQSVKQKIDNIKNKEIRLDEIIKQLTLAKETYQLAAQNLSIKRKEAALNFEHSLLLELAPLKMENTRFRVNIEELPEESWSRYGIDKISFLASTNPGMPFAPLIKIASGGELSRFMLAMKVVLSAIKSVPTLIFDEVDTGIGGAVADAVGRRMELLGINCQVLAVTHHPQVAARSSFHLKISKEVFDSATVTRVEEISGDIKRKEIARMLAGETITTEALAAAARLMEVA